MTSYRSKFIDATSSYLFSGFSATWSQLKLESIKFLSATTTTATTVLSFIELRTIMIRTNNSNNNKARQTNRQNTWTRSGVRARARAFMICDLLIDGNQHSAQFASNILPPSVYTILSRCIGFIILFFFISCFIRAPFDWYFLCSDRWCDLSLSVCQIKCITYAY